MNENNLDVKLALEEMRFNMQQSINAGDTLDQKVEFILIVAGLILALATTLQVSLSPNHSCLYWIVLLVAIILYVVALSAILFTSMPKTYHLAIASDWEELDKQIFGKVERDAILSMLSGYIEQIQYNEKINRRRAKLHIFSLFLLIVTIIFIISLGAIQYFSYPCGG